MIPIKPIDVARKLNISTSALRHYEAWGIIPRVPRSANGYRVYTQEHVAYLECIRAMLPGFGMDLIKEALIKLQSKDVVTVILLVNKAQYQLYKERMIAEDTIKLLEAKAFDTTKLMRNKEWINIGEVASIAKIPTTAIRHWERAGLIKPPRDAENGYRRFYPQHLRQILFIASLKKTVYFLDAIRVIVKELEDNNIEVVRKAAVASLSYFDEVSKLQLRGVHALYHLCKELNLLD